jgi:hypothetical protein
MQDPYKMILISVFLTFLLLIGIFFGKIFFKKKVNLFLLLLIISLIPIVSIFRSGVYESGDFTIHIYRAMDFYESLRQGIFIPSWAGKLNSGFGYPVFLFIYIIPYYLISFFHFLGFSFVMSLKIILALAYVFSGISIWYVLKKLTKNEYAAFTGSIVYLFSPYHLVDLHFRVAIAEVLVFLIAPIIFYWILKIKDDFKIIYFVWLSLFLGILFLTHPAMYIIYSSLYLLYISFEIVVKKSSKKLIIIYILSLLTSLVISSFSWMSRIFLSSITESSMLINIPVSFVHFKEILYSTWKLGFLFQGPYGQISYMLGYAGVFILLISVFFLIKKRQIKKVFYGDIFFWTLISFCIIFVMLPYSKILWDNFKFLNLMQFAYRFLHVLTFCIAILASYLSLNYIKKTNIVYLLLACAIFYTVLNWGNRKMIPNVNDQVIRQNLPNSTKEEEKMIEATPLWWNTSRDFLNQPKNTIETINGSAKIQIINRSNTEHVYKVNAISKTTMVDNTLYFPEWRVIVNEKEIPINYKYHGYNARIVFEIPKGESKIKVEYNDIKEIKYAKKISITVFFFLVSYLFIYYAYQFFIYIKIYLDKKR